MSRRRAAAMDYHHHHPYSAAALGEDIPQKRPYLPPLPIIRPSTAPSSCSSSNMADTRGLMKRLLAKPAPPSSSSSPMKQHLHHPQDEQINSVQEITTSSPTPTEGLLTPRSINEFDKSIRALDLVGQVDISMTPEFVTGSPGFAKKQRDGFRQSPSYSASTTPSVLTSDYSVGFESVEDSPITPLASTPITPRPRRCSSPALRPTTPKKLPPTPSTSFAPVKPKPRPILTHSPRVEQLPRRPATANGIGVSSAPRDLFWDSCGAYWDKKEEEAVKRSEDGDIGGKWRTNNSDLQTDSKLSSNTHQFRSVDKEQEMIKKSPEGHSPGKRLWKLVKKISVSGLREKGQSESDQPPPVPPLPSDLSTATSPLASSSTVPLDRVPRPVLVPSTPAQHSNKLPHSSPHSPSQGPRPSTTRSSSPSSDVASSRFFTRQSAHSSTSSFGEEMAPLPPLPQTSISISITPSTNAKAKDIRNNIQQHIVPPHELRRHYSITGSGSLAIPIHQSSPSMEDDWTIVRSPSVELEGLLLPPSPRHLFKGIFMSAVLIISKKRHARWS